MGDLHDDLREVMGLLGSIVPPQKPLPDLLLATYHEARGWNACREAMLALIRQHGPALLARQEGEWLPIESAPKKGRVMLYDADRIPSILIAHWRQGAWWGDMTNSGRSIVWRDATHWRTLPAPPAARSGGGG